MHYAISCRCCFIGDATVGCVLLFEGSSSKFLSSGMRICLPIMWMCGCDADILVILHAIAFSGFLAILLFLHATEVADMRTARDSIMSLQHLS